MNMSEGPGSFLQRAVLLSGAAAAGIGGLALTGWATNLRLLTSVQKGYIPIAPNTALLFFLLGRALFACTAWPFNRGVQKSVAGIAYATLILSGITLVGFVTGLNTMILEQYGYKTIEAENGEKATEKFIENKDTIAILLLDMIMPVKNGRYAYEEIKKLKPDIKVIFTSGYTDDILSSSRILEEKLDFLSKPTGPVALLRTIREALDR